MKKIMLGVLVLLLSVSSVAANAQGKTTADPNNTKTIAKEEVDQRLLQKITYTSGYKRLHMVTEDLSGISGVPIGCGQNKKDWRVRDIPLVVCVKDMPLGKLLRAIADATHTWFASEKIGSDSATSYLIYRRYKEEQRINDYFKRRHDGQLEAIKWEWDALIAYANSPEITDWPDWMMKTRTSDLRMMSRLIATLGPNAWNKMLEGETLTLKKSDPLCNEFIEQLYQNCSTSNLARANSDQPDLEVKIKVKDTGPEGDISLAAQLGPIITKDNSLSSRNILIGAGQLSGKLKNLPAYPKQESTPALQEDMSNPSILLLGRLPDETWSYPELKVRIDVNKPDGVKQATFADLINATASASGVNIVTEDFTSQQPLEKTSGYEYQQFDRLFGKQTDIASILTNIKPQRGVLGTDYTWFYNQNDKLLVGWADDGSAVRWRDQHKNLVSADYLDNLKMKLNGVGLELDDIAPLFLLPNDTFRQWIANSRDLSIINISTISPAPWILYASLKDIDREKAKSEAGLPLAGLDYKWIDDLYRSLRFEADIDCDVPSAPAVPQEWADQQNMHAKKQADFTRIIGDPTVVSTMVMRVVQSPTTMRWNPHGSIEKSPLGLKLSKYQIQFTYTLDGETRKYRVDGPNLAFPVYSPAREAEILKTGK